jgi:hypothetical protein
MRPFRLFLSVAGLIAILLAGSHPAVIAQEATPAAGEMEPEGITFEPVGFAIGATVISPADLIVVRLGLEPGTGFPLEASDPSSGILVVESGTFTVNADAEVTVTRGAQLGAAVATAEATGDFSGAMEAVPAGEVVTLEAGDAAFVPGSITGEIRNDGEERAVGLAFLIAPSEGMMAEATPAP